MMNMAIQMMEHGLLPDALLRRGIRALLQERLRNESKRFDLPALVKELKHSPIAIETAAANEQHYELPAAFFQQVLGPRLKYSSCYFPEASTTLPEAEEAMLALTAERAEVQDGMELLELGCGWGSLSIWLAEHYPACRILSVSNSHSQRTFIQTRCRALGLSNLDVVTCDMNDFNTERRFDRVLSVEMFEHLRNYQLLLERIAGWLQPDGKLFVHIFSHHTLAYPFETDGAKDWMARYFFTGGIMPSHGLLPCFNDHLQVVKDWTLNGTHYGRTLRAWLDLQDAARQELMPLFTSTYGRDAAVWFERWRIFFIACEELFRANQGEEWGVSHYLFERAS